MLIMIIGLVLFLGAHSVRIYAEDWRNEFIDQRGENTWLGLIAIVSLIGFILIIMGYGQARLDSVMIWSPPVWTKHVAALITLPAFIFLVSAYIPGTKIKAIIHHPMIIGVKLWAFAHLLANGMLTDMILFGSFLIWAILDFSASRKRDKAEEFTYEAISLSRDIISIAVGLSAWVVFAMVLHGVLIGVRPFG